MQNFRERKIIIINVIATYMGFGRQKRKFVELNFQVVTKYDIK